MSDGAGRYPSGAMRASDADRDAVLAELSEHFQAGRLTSDELEERTGQALQARTLGDLALLTADLPSLGLARPTASRADGPAGDPPARPGLGWPRRPVAAGLVAVVAVAGALAVAGTGALGSHLLVLILVVPLVARRVVSRRRR
jgi:hypothetical protein